MGILLVLRSEVIKIFSGSWLLAGLLFSLTGGPPCFAGEESNVLLDEKLTTPLTEEEITSCRYFQRKYREIENCTSLTRTDDKFAITQSGLLRKRKLTVDLDKNDLNRCRAVHENFYGFPDGHTQPKDPETEFIANFKNRKGTWLSGEDWLEWLEQVKSKTSSTYKKSPVLASFAVAYTASWIVTIVGAPLSMINSTWRSVYLTYEAVVTPLSAVAWPSIMAYSRASGNIEMKDMLLIMPCLSFDPRRQAAEGINCVSKAYDTINSPAEGPLPEIDLDRLASSKKSAASPLENITTRFTCAMYEAIDHAFDKMVDETKCERASEGGRLMIGGALPAYTVTRKENKVLLKADPIKYGAESSELDITFEAPHRGYEKASLRLSVSRTSKPLYLEGIDKAVYAIWPKIQSEVDKCVD